MQLASCHPNRKHKAHGLCGACYEKYLKEKNPEYHKKYKDYQREIYAKNPESYKKRAKVYNQSTDPEKVRSRRNGTLKRKYGITIDQYDKLLSDQNGGCAICGRKPGKTPLHVDHCHLSGVVRGILCHQCNWYMGTIEASSEVWENLLNYVRKSNAIKSGGKSKRVSG